MDGSLPTWLNDILDKATGTFTKFADLQIFEKQLQIARETQLFSDAQAAEDSRITRQVNGGGFGFGLDRSTLLMLAAGLGVVILFWRR